MVLFGKGLDHSFISILCLLVSKLSIYIVWMTDYEKESHDNGLSFSEARKQGNEDSKYTPPLRIKENMMEGFKENQKKDVAGVKAKNFSRKISKSGSNPSATKKTISGTACQKGVLHGHKSSNIAPEKKFAASGIMLFTCSQMTCPSCCSRSCGTWCLHLCNEVS